jgi:CHRD domain-containing protein
MKHKVSAALLAVVVLYPAGGANAQAATTYKARLSPVPLDATMVGNVVGSGSVTATLTGSKLSITGTFEGLRSPATAARIHKSPKPGIRGPAILDLKASAGSSGTISGAFDLTAAQVQELAQGRYYVQLHSEKAPDGNLWGWLSLQENRR